jgi:hypothetical protein
MRPNLFGMQRGQQVLNDQQFLHGNLKLSKNNLLIPPEGIDITAAVREASKFIKKMEKDIIIIQNSE